MVDLYRSARRARQVAGRFGVSLRSVTRLLQQRGVRCDELGRRSVGDRRSIETCAAEDALSPDKGQLPLHTIFVHGDARRFECMNSDTAEID